MAGGQMLQIAEQSIGAERCELQLDGELDLWSVEQLQAVLQRVARDNNAVVVGLENCKFVDSTGIALLLQVRRQLEFEGVPPRHLRLLRPGAASLHRRRPDRGRADHEGRSAALSELISHI